MPPPDRDIEAIAEQVFAALADPSRRAILGALAQFGPATATDLAERLPITRQAIAKHLGLLSEAGLVRVLVEDTVARRELVPQLELEHLGETGIGPILTEIRVMSARDEEIGYAALSARFADERIVRLIGRIAMQTEPVGDLNYARSCIASLQRDHLLAECRRIQRRIEATADGSVHAELTAKKFEMSQRIRELS